MNITKMQIDELFFSAAIMVTAFFSGIVIYFIIGFTLKSFSHITTYKRTRDIFEKIKKALRSLIPDLCVSAVLFTLRFDESVVVLISHGVLLWIIASLGWLAVRIIYVVREIILERYDIKAQDNLTARHAHTQIKVIGNIINIGVFVLTVAWILMTFPAVKQVGLSLLASAGVLGIILGFATQKNIREFNSRYPNSHISAYSSG